MRSLGGVVGKVPISVTRWLPTLLHVPFWRPVREGNLSTEFNDFVIVHDGEQVTKHPNPKHLKRHEKNLVIETAETSP